MAMAERRQRDLRDENVDEIGGRRTRGSELAEDGDDEIVG